MEWMMLEMVCKGPRPYTFTSGLKLTVVCTCRSNAFNSNALCQWDYDSSLSNTLHVTSYILWTGTEFHTNLYQGPHSLCWCKNKLSWSNVYMYLRNISNFYNDYFRLSYKESNLLKALTHQIHAGKSFNTLICFVFYELNEWVTFKKLFLFLFMGFINVNSKL